VSRPSKYTAETVAKLTEAVRKGASYSLACGLAGISEDTFATWRRDKAGFSDCIKAAEAEGAVAILEQIARAAADPAHWQAGAWLLERRYPASYGRRVPRIAGELDVRDDRTDGAIAIREIIINLPPEDAPLRVPSLDTTDDRDDDAADDLAERQPSTLWRER
jgi:hypothetical protein